MSRRVLCTKQESWATVLVCRKNLLTRFRIVFCFIRVLHLVSCRYFSHAEVLVTTCSRTVSRLLKILVRFLLNRSTMGKKNRFWPNRPSSVHPFILADMKCVTDYFLSPGCMKIAFTNVWLIDICRNRLPLPADQCHTTLLQAQEYSLFSWRVLYSSPMTSYGFHVNAGSHTFFFNKTVFESARKRFAFSLG